MRSKTFGRRREPPQAVEDSQFVERRRCPRRRVFERARIVVGDDRPATECLIRDLSDGGAGLRLHSAIELPELFVLEAGKIGARICRIVWQSDADLGVAFASSASAA